MQNVPSHCTLMYFSVHISTSTYCTCEVFVLQWSCPTFRGRLKGDGVNDGLEEYTVREVERILRKKRRYIYKLVRDGNLPARREGKEIRIAKVDLEAYVERTKIRPPRTT
jgi:excisionase family DNA binding protein